MAISSNTKKLFIRVLLFLLYLLLGAAIFYGIEQRKEVQLRGENTFKSQYQNFTQRYNISKKDMLEFIEGLQRALKLGYNTKTESWPGYSQWDFMNAFHFAGNVVTTIGKYRYGHITPVTTWGQIICIIYALFGIPLTGLTLRSIGNRISEFIALTIKSFDRRFYNRETDKLEIKTAVVAFGCLLVIIFIPAVGFAQIEQWNYMEAVYFCFITLTTIGFGDFVPGATRIRYDDGLEAVLEVLNLFYMVLGLAVMSGVIVSISGVIEEKTKNLGVVDPLEALRNIRVENLNSRALKKLGYKMGPAVPQGTAHESVPIIIRRVRKVPKRHERVTKITKLQTLNESIEIREEAELDGSETFCEDPKNNLVVQVQLTPMPSPRESPVPARSSFDSLPLTHVKSVDADSEQIETYEESIKGSIDSSQAFLMDRTDSIQESKTSVAVEKEESKDSTNDTTNVRNTHYKPRTKDVMNSRTKNGFVSKMNQHSKPMLKHVKGRTLNPVEHVDLGDKSITKTSR
ncbi:hypothetical protein QZH41_016185 [Actinostola sp. cb2023]|nr:hypothetical protein QZH41_016185 [Actinostola sp. cb2023]